MRGTGGRQNSVEILTYSEQGTTEEGVLDLEGFSLQDSFFIYKT